MSARADGPSPAAAIAWEFRQRHRWGLIALIGYVLVAAAIRLVIFARGQTIHLDNSEIFAAVVMVPLSATFTYFLGVFTFGFAGDLTARQSMYPPRMFTLPVTTAALAGWPMLYGTTAMAVLWLLTRALAVWPSTFDVPVIWPALMAASMLAWAQALTWMPYGLPGLRVIVIMLWLTALDSVVFLALEFKARESVMLAILAPNVPLAYFVARFAVARARRGDVPDWRGAFAWLGQHMNILSGRREHFSSPASAQAWFEWRRHGRTLPAWVGILLPLELALLWIAGHTSSLVLLILVGVLITPPFMAAFTAADLSKPAPFGLTRPLSNSTLIAAKLKMTIWSTAAAWLLVLIAIPVALRLSHTAPLVIDEARRSSEVIGTPRVIVLVLLILSAAIVTTWRQLVQSLFIGLSGREWLGKASVFAALVFLSVLGPVADWIINDREVRGRLWYALAWIPAVPVLLKMSGAAWIATRLSRSRVLSDRALVAGAACWCAAVLALYAVFVWFFTTPFVPRYILALLAILAVPLTRLSAAPLALAWNRHR